MGLLKLGQYAQEPERRRSCTRSPSCVTQSSADLLNDWFEFDPLKGTKSASGIIGTFLGPHSPGTAYVLLHHYMGEIDGAFRAWGFAKNGNGGVTAAIASSARALGVEIRTNALGRAGHRQGRPRRGRRAGERRRAAREGRHVGGRPEAQLPAVRREQAPARTSSSQQIRNFRVRGSSGKVNIALSELPDFTCLPGEGPLHRGAISISPSMEYIERAYDEAKYGQFAKNPYIDMIIPSMIDRDMAPPGHHVMSCFVQYAPYDIEGGWDDAKRDAFGETVISTHRALRAEHPPRDRRQAGDHAEGHRAHRRHHRRQHLPRRTAAAPTVLPAARRRNGPTSARRCPAITSARPARIRAAA